MTDGISGERRSDAATGRRRSPWGELLVAGMLGLISVPIAGDVTPEWWLATLAALVVGGAFAAADRAGYGQWAPLVLAGLGILALFYWATAGLEAQMVLVAPLALGAGVGMAPNRLLFGVVFPMPDQSW